jgi:hypothetical protein
VLAPVTAVDLINRMQQVGAALTKADIVKANPPAGEKRATAAPADGKYKETFIYALRGRRRPVIGSARQPDIFTRA